MSERQNIPRIHRRDGLLVVSMGSMHMWDLADLQSLRETLKRLMEFGNCADVGIDMQHVRSLAPGFFGVLSGMKERGLRVWIISPQPAVREMLWFRAFCEPVSGDRFILLTDPKEDIIRATHLVWESEAKQDDSRVWQSTVCRPELKSRSVPQFIQAVATDLSPSVAILDRLRAHRNCDHDHNGDIVGIRLSACSIDDADLARIASLKTVKQLLLDNTKITDNALSWISELTTLRTLNLLGTSITDSGLRHLQSLTNLEELNLSKTRITDSGLQHLRRMRRLVHLALYETPFSDRGVADLIRLTGLEQLWIGKTRITQDGRRQLRQALPNCNIL